MKKLCSVCGGTVPRDRHKHGGKYCSQVCEKSDLGYAKNTERKKIRKALIEAGTAYAPPPPDPAKHLVSGYPILVIGDVHCPMQCPYWIEKALEAAEKFECKNLIINGDLIDANQISRHMGQEFRRKATLEDDMDAAEKFMQLMCEQFDAVYYTLGNHTARMIHRFNGELSIQRLLKMIYDSPKIIPTQKTWMKVNKNTRVLHPRSYSQIRGKLTADLCQLYQQHIVTGHHHHSATTVSKDGRWQAIEVGCLADIEKFSYVQDHMGNHPHMMNGFAIIMPDETFLNFNKFTPWKVYGL
jgi:predicted phosphodiesterase/endogenous inhibitor of DNA gyrase (YacG/DUF329 family)